MGEVGGSVGTQPFNGRDNIWKISKKCTVTELKEMTFFSMGKRFKNLSLPTPTDSFGNLGSQPNYEAEKLSG